MSKSKSETVVIAYKGFDKDMSCRGHKFRVGESYTHNGKVKICNSGFHACEHPLDVLNYYPATTSKFASVELSGKIDRSEDQASDTKVCAASINIKAELSLAQLAQCATAYVRQATRGAKTKRAFKKGGHASAAGAGGHASAAGKDSVAVALGRCGAAKAAAGNWLAIAHYDDEGNLLGVKTAQVGKEGIKPDTFYRMSKDGKFTEVKE